MISTEPIKNKNKIGFYILFYRKQFFNLGNEDMHSLHYSISISMNTLNFSNNHSCKKYVILSLKYKKIRVFVMTMNKLFFKINFQINTLGQIIIMFL